ncbi:alpha/beta fold hydrolase [Burkholderia cenocepacia]|uniref:alpha/beta fold hydrolase n=1 Tax=Burkholderia cenocepacia TaxID=95486 RepID=UPI002859BA53|nr:alpha/beta fold hydrolase [Burkholderia cenocepacia]MDR5644412.1 alpha/beta fold hydrolase [Burkholderia cenocepacia]
MDRVVEGFVAVDGQQLGYARSGTTPSIVFLHGIPTSRYLWRKVAQTISQAGFGWLAFDLLGYGQSSKPTDVDLGIGQQARIISLALAALDWRGGLVVGHDIGGGIAQLLMLNHAACIHGAVLVDTIAYDSFPEPGIARLKDPAWDSILGDPNFDLKKGFEKGLRKGMHHTARVTPELVQAYERPFTGVSGRQAYLRAARALRSTDLTERTAEIEAIPCPVLLVSGANDSFQPPQFARRLAERLVRGKFVLIGSAGHFLPEDEPEELARMITNFIGTTLQSVKVSRSDDA